MFKHKGACGVLGTRGVRLVVWLVGGALWFSGWFLVLRSVGLFLVDLVMVAWWNVKTTSVAIDHESMFLSCFPKSSFRLNRLPG